MKQVDDYSVQLLDEKQKLKKELYDKNKTIERCTNALSMMPELILMNRPIGTGVQDEVSVTPLCCNIAH